MGHRARLEANTASAAFTGTLLATTVDKRWLALPALVGVFLFQHAVQGWCPPVPILRRLGYRTSREIETERLALKALRGDFGNIGPGGGARDSEASHPLQGARLRHIIYVPGASVVKRTAHQKEHSPKWNP